MTADTEVKMPTAPPSPAFLPPPSPAISEFDYAVKSENSQDAAMLREYIKKLDKAYHDKTTALRSAYSKIEFLNAETERQQTKINDLIDENKTVKETMQGMADQLTDMEKDFKSWQESLIAQQQAAQQLLIAEHFAERTHLENHIAQLRASVDLASDENQRLQGMISELSDTNSQVMNLTGGSDYVMHSADIEYMDKVQRLEEDKRALSEEVVNITKRRVELKVRLEEVEENFEQLEGMYEKALRENKDLRQENEALHDKLAKFAGAELSTELETVGLED